ncbi:hypothetical protein D3C86_2190540 [compost metagenome]
MATIIGVKVISRITDEPKVNANAITIGVPVMATTFNERCKIVMTSTVNSIDQGKIISRSS